jgi:hypothetical protein
MATPSPPPRWAAYLNKAEAEAELQRGLAANRPQRSNQTPSDWLNSLTLVCL